MNSTVAPTISTSGKLKFLSLDFLLAKLYHLQPSELLDQHTKLLTRGGVSFKKESNKLLVLFLIGYILLPAAIASFLRKS